MYETNDKNDGGNQKLMTPKKTIYYTNELEDDFANNNIDTKHIRDDFVYYHKGFLWKILKFLLYRLIAMPVAFITCYIIHGAKIVNKKAIKEIKSSGFFLYGNHTQEAFDAFMPSIISFPKANYIIAGPDAFSIKGLSTIVQVMGGIPVPETKLQAKNYYDCVKHHINEKSVITTYPEAHIWPYFNGVKNFKSNSFNNPVRMNVPVVAFAVTYKERKVFKKAKPRIVVYISDPIYPNENLSRQESIQELRNKVYDFIKEKTDQDDNVSYYEYVKK